MLTDYDNMLAIKNSFELNSVLKFTHELAVDNKLPFLDVLVKFNGKTISTSVYRKPTNDGNCLSEISEFPCVINYLF